MFDPTIDQPGLLTGTAEFLTGLVFFPLVCLIIQFLFRCTSSGQFLRTKYNLRSHAIHDISNKVTSSTFAVLACSTGLSVVMACNQGDVEDILTSRFYILDNYLIFGVSYFIYDMVSMYLVFSTEHKEEVSVSTDEVLKFLKSRALILLHHLLVPLLGFPVMMIARQGRGDCILGTSFLIEASTPFVSLRVILVHLKLKESTSYVVNGLLMLFSFMLCRVLLFPMLYMRYSSMTGLSMFSVISTTPLWVHLLVLGLWAPQLVWFNKMLKGTVKILRGRPKESVKGTLKDANISNIMNPANTKVTENAVDKETKTPNDHLEDTREEMHTKHMEDDNPTVKNKKAD